MLVFFALCPLELSHVARYTPSLNRPNHTKILRNYVSSNFCELLNFFDLLNNPEAVLFIYNSLTRRKEPFKPIHEGRVGMYVCGPTVYGDAHLGHARPAITFDILFRYLQSLGYKVRYVRNITDVGHLEHDADEGEDKIAKKARLEQLEPMEIVQRYLTRYHHDMELLNVLPPSIEPHASGHIIEQIEYIKRILEAGYAYESRGSVYFDVEKYNRDYHYGKLSGRKIEDLDSNTRALDGQDEKRNPLDFALWKKASPYHIMHWPSPWSEGFPGWHLECSTMGTKYLGERFDIHGGGLDLLFPHHECEIAQSVAACGHEAVNYWMHNNMITIEGKKMGKSYGNFITLEEFFNGSHPKLERAYAPMVIRFFILMAHYRSTVDFSNAALQAAEKALQKVNEAWNRLRSLKPGAADPALDLAKLEERCSEAMDDDLNTPQVLAAIFEACKSINAAANSETTLSEEQIAGLEKIFSHWLFDILGVRLDSAASAAAGGEDAMQPYREAVDLLMEIRGNAKAAKDWTTSDLIRDRLAQIGFDVKDTKNGVEWSLK